MQRLVALLALSLVTACGGSTETSNDSTTTAVTTTGPELSGGYPQDVVVGPGSGPALFLDGQSPAVGYVSAGAAARITGPAENGRYPVRIRGPLKIRGYLAANRVGAYVQQRGRARGCPCYLGPNDLVGLGAVNEDGHREIVVAPEIGYGVTLGPFDCVYPSDRIAAEQAADGAEEPSPGELFQLPAGQEVQIYDRPDREVILTVPAHDPPFSVEVVRDRGEWKGVRIGSGPYVIGYVNVALTPGASNASAETPEVPRRLLEEGERRLYRVAEGARVKFEGRTFAIFGEAGYAREMNRYDDENVLDVFAAADDEIAVRGMVDERYLELVETEAVPEPEAEENFEDDFE